MQPREVSIETPRTSANGVRRVAQLAAGLDANYQRQYKSLLARSVFSQYVYVRHRPANKCLLVIEYQGQAFVGTLLFDDQAFGVKVCDLFRELVGRALYDIED